MGRIERECRAEWGRAFVVAIWAEGSLIGEESGMDGRTRTGGRKTELGIVDGWDSSEGAWRDMRETGRVGGEWGSMQADERIDEAEGMD